MGLANPNMCVRSMLYKYTPSLPRGATPLPLLVRLSRASVPNFPESGGAPRARGPRGRLTPGGGCLAVGVAG